jgi:hypothetical protein
MSIVILAGFYFKKIKFKMIDWIKKKAVLSRYGSKEWCNKSVNNVSYAGLLL